MKKFKGKKRAENLDDHDQDDEGGLDYTEMAIGASAKKKSPPKPDESKKKKKMPDAAKKALKFAIRAKLKKSKKSDESE